MTKTPDRHTYIDKQHELDEIRGLQRSNVWDYENGFYWFSSPTRLNKILAQYELYKSIVSLPGDILELGVFKAASLVRLATFRSLLETDYSRKIVGFDVFGKFPKEELSLKSDLNFIDGFEKASGDGLTLEEVRNIFLLKNYQNISLNEGNVFDTLPTYLEKFPATRVSFLHLDLDVKEPTTFALEQLWERVVPNGIVVFDDYSCVAGETDAVDDFIKIKHLKLEKTSHYSSPSYIRKPVM